MKYKQIRYKTVFKSKDEAKIGMKKAQAFGVPGLGKWKIEKIGDSYDLIFMPSLVLKFALNKHEIMWHQIANQTQTSFREELKTDTITAFVE